MAKRFSRNKGELSTTCNPKVTSRFPSAPDATSLHHCLKTNMLSVVRVQVLCTVEEGVSNTCI